MLIKKWWLAVVLSLMVAVVAGSAEAHEIEIVRSDPAADSVLEKSPEVVVIWFSDEIQSEGSTLEVFNDKGEQVDNGDGGIDLDDPEHASMRVTLPHLPGGAYIVRWHAVLPDGDASEGEFGFFVGTAAEATDQASSTSSSGEGARCLVGGLGGVFIFLAATAAIRRRALYLYRM